MRLGHPGDPIAFVVGEGEVGDRGSIGVGALGLSQVDPVYKITTPYLSIEEESPKSCVYWFSASGANKSWSKTCRGHDLPTCCGSPAYLRSRFRGARQGQPSQQR